MHFTFIRDGSGDLTRAVIELASDENEGTARAITVGLKTFLSGEVPILTLGSHTFEVI